MIEFICILALGLMLLGAYDVLKFIGRMIKKAYDYFKRKAIEKEAERIMKDRFGV